MSVKCNVKAKKFYLKIALISNVDSAKVHSPFETFLVIFIFDVFNTCIC